MRDHRRRNLGAARYVGTGTEQRRDEATVTTATAPSAALTAEDRCDRCGAQAYLRVQLQSGGELLFCAHHAREHGDTLQAVAATVVDETHQLGAHPCHRRLSAGRHPPPASTTAPDHQVRGRRASGPTRFARVAPWPSPSSLPGGGLLRPVGLRRWPAARRASAWAVALVSQLGGAAGAGAVALAVGGDPRGSRLGVGGAGRRRQRRGGRVPLPGPVRWPDGRRGPGQRRRRRRAAGGGGPGGRRSARRPWPGPASWWRCPPSGWWPASLRRRPRRPGGPERARRTGVLAGLGFGVLFAAVGQIPEDAGFAPLVAERRSWGPSSSWRSRSGSAPRWRPGGSGSSGPRAHRRARRLRHRRCSWSPPRAAR